MRMRHQSIYSGAKQTKIRNSSIKLQAVHQNTKCSNRIRIKTITVDSCHHKWQQTRRIPAEANCQGLLIDRGCNSTLDKPFADPERGAWTFERHQRLIDEEEDLEIDRPINKEEGVSATGCHVMRACAHEENRRCETECCDETTTSSHFT